MAGTFTVWQEGDIFEYAQHRPRKNQKKKIEIVPNKLLFIIKIIKILQATRGATTIIKSNKYFLVKIKMFLIWQVIFTKELLQ